jgi:hypothetical protein
MDHKQMIMQRVQDLREHHLDEVLRQALHQIQHDWHTSPLLEAPPMWALLRLAEGERAVPAALEAVVQSEINQARREILMQILDAGVSALEKLLTAAALPELTPEDLFALEFVFLLYGRPALVVRQGRLTQVPEPWQIVENQRQDIELTQRGVGRIELLGHSDYDWAGTGFLVSHTCVMTTRSVAQMFAERKDAGAWQYRPGISAWMDYQEDCQRPAAAAYRVQQVIGVHDRYDLALLEVEPPQQNGESPTPLTLSAEAPSRSEGRPVYLVSYPVRDARRGESGTIARVFCDVYNGKRIQPGRLCGIVPVRDISLLRHDCAPLGHSGGGCLVDLETHHVLGLHVSGRYLENGTAVPLWVLHGDPLMEKGQVTWA